MMLWTEISQLPLRSVVYEAINPVVSVKPAEWTVGVVVKGDSNLRGVCLFIADQFSEDDDRGLRIGSRRVRMYGDGRLDNFFPTRLKALETMIAWANLARVKLLDSIEEERGDQPPSASEVGTNEPLGTSSQ